MEQNEIAMVIRIQDVLAITGSRNRSSIYRRMRRGEFPEAVEIGNGNVGWIREEVVDWVKRLPRRKYYVAKGQG